MGRALGFHDSDELDRPELNKCPDCQCYFATEECPLCGKICPEEMRAGNRAKVKPPKKRQSSSGRVQFVSWYHSWWFILLMLYFMPIVGIVLFFTSPHSKKSKIIAGAIVVALYALSIALSFGVGFWGLFEKPLVNDDIPREEYVEQCLPMTVEDFYRNAYDNEGAYVTLDVEVLERLTEYNADIYDTPSTGVYYRCRGLDGGEVTIYVLDCNLERKTNYLVGERLRVFGEGGGMVTVWKDYASSQELPCLYMAYCEPLG